MSKFFKKSKKNYFGAILGLFLPKIAQKYIFLEKGLCQFLNISPLLNIYHHAKNQKKTNDQFLRKMQTTVILYDPPLDGGPLKEHHENRRKNLF